MAEYITRIHSRLNGSSCTIGDNLGEMLKKKNAGCISDLMKIANVSRLNNLEVFT